MTVSYASGGGRVRVRMACINSGPGACHTVAHWRELGHASLLALLPAQQPNLGRDRTSSFAHSCQDARRYRWPSCRKTSRRTVNRFTGGIPIRHFVMAITGGPVRPDSTRLRLAACTGRAEMIGRRLSQAEAKKLLARFSRH